MSAAGLPSRLHLRRAAVIPLAIAAAAAIAACGGSSHSKAAAAPVKASPAALVSQTFSASDAVDSGRIALSLTATLNGIKQLAGKPIAFEISGPFARGAGEGLSTDLAATVSLGASKADLGLVKVGKDVYVGIDGTYYDLPASVTSGSALGASGLSGAASGATGVSGMLAALGIAPKSLLSDPHIVGQADVGGVATEHLRAQINVAALLGDVSKLASGATGATGATSSSSVLELIESAITSAQVDIYTGVSDHIMRKVDVAIDFTVPALAAGAVDGLTGGSLDLDITLTQLGQQETITAPANPQPSSKLLNGVFALESQFGSLASLVARA